MLSHKCGNYCRPIIASWLLRLRVCVVAAGECLIYVYVGLFMSYQILIVQDFLKYRE